MFGVSKQFNFIPVLQSESLVRDSPADNPFARVLFLSGGLNSGSHIYKDLFNPPAARAGCRASPLLLPSVPAHKSTLCRAAPTLELLAAKVNSVYSR